MKIDFSVGVWTHREGKSPPRKTGVSKLFIDANPVWFKGCTCKKEIAPVLDRWGESPPTEMALTTVARTLKNKNPEVELDTILDALTTFAENLHV